MLHDPRIERREKRRLDALKRVEQIDNIIGLLTGNGWCRGQFFKYGADTLKITSCLVGAAWQNVPAPRGPFYRMLVRHLPMELHAGKPPSVRLIEFNDSADSVELVVALLRKARDRQVKRAGLASQMTRNQPPEQNQ